MGYSFDTMRYIFSVTCFLRQVWSQHCIYLSMKSVCLHADFFISISISNRAESFIRLDSNRVVFGNKFQKIGLKILM